MLLTFQRPIDLKQPLILDVPFPELSAESNHLGGPSLEDLDKVLLGQGDGKNGKVMQVSMEVAKPGTFGYRIPTRNLNRTYKRTEKEVAEDDEILDALENFGGGFYGGFEGLLEQFGRTGGRSTRSLSKSPAQSGDGQVTNEANDVSAEEFSAQEGGEGVPSWSFDVATAQKVDIPLPKTASTTVSIPPLRFRPNAFRDTSAPSPSPSPALVPIPPKASEAMPTVTPPPRPTSAAERITQTAKDSARQRARAAAIAAHEIAEARAAEEAERAEQSRLEAERKAEAEKNAKSTWMRNIAGRSTPKEAPERYEAEVVGPAPSRVERNEGRRAKQQPVAEDKPNEDEKPKKGLLGRLFGR